MDLEIIFFELLRVAIGNADSLSYLPSANEWKKLYELAKKQSLIGICFAGLQRLVADTDDGFIRIGITENLYYQWIGMAAMIQKKNEIVNLQCWDLQERLCKENLLSCILKGQSVAYLYGKHLSCLRQSGDIDVWVNASRKDIIKYVQKIAATTNVREHHMELKAFRDTEVEVHFWPAVIRHFLKNRKLQRWFDEQREVVFNNHINLYCSSECTICAPTPEFHAVQQMAHMYHHLFDSGIGLRQVMDYYFVLLSLKSNSTQILEVSRAIKHIGMGRFASAMMYVLEETMGLKSEKMICEPNEEDGKFLLSEIMRGGNFGKYDDRKTRDTKNYFSSFYGGIIRNLRYLRFNPFDWFWSPLWRLYFFGWRKSNGYM